MLCILFAYCLSIRTVFALSISAPALEQPIHARRQITSLSGEGSFSQYIDHNNLSKGTFSQHFWYNATHWKGPGSPIIFYTPGQNAAATHLSYLTDATLPGLVASQLGGAVILVEHRFFGDSIPFLNLTTENMQYLTLEQVLADFVHFARTVELVFDQSGKSHPSQTPWIWIGNSYSAALVAWAERMVPGTFWAYYASGAMVNIIYDFWQFNYATQQGMPQNCRSSFEAIINHIDLVFSSGSPEEQYELKKKFGLQDLSQLDDAANALSQPMMGWTYIQPSDQHPQFYEMCNEIGRIEADPFTRRDDKWNSSLERVVDNYAKWFTASFLPGKCDSYGYSDWAGQSNVQCYDTVNPSWQAFQDHSVHNTIDRSYYWMTCSFFLFRMTGAPKDKPTIVSRLVTTSYFERQCNILFPSKGNSTYRELRKTASEAMNILTGGWDHRGKRILFTNGELDPWRSASLSSEFRPGGPMLGTPEQPITLIKGVQHCADMLVRNRVNDSVREAMDIGIAQLSAWVAEFPIAEKHKEIQHPLLINCIH
ncbi:endoprotease [Colletotrichum zoysiae]|uniref:Endoprotease n=1 Tax=Colletotrichum zoysiae TaxID=1216348 RepID=A0AAD9LWB6_9PEZI|nr:endoprotease [Colletotrichum zoysiae]